MITSVFDGEDRQTYYTNSSNIGSASGCVFLDAFTKSLEEDNSDAVTVGSARSVIALNAYTSSGEAVAFTIDSSDYINDSADPRADKYFDDAENVLNALKSEYAKIKEMGFTDVEISDTEFAEISQVFARVSAFSHYNDQDYYGENNLGRYELSTGMVVDMVHQEFVVSSDYSEQNGGVIPANWTDTNPISSLPGFEDFSSGGFDKVIALPDGSDIDDPSDGDAADGATGDTDDTSGTDGTGSTDGSDDADNDDSDGIDSKYHIEDDEVIKALFKLLTENTETVGYGSAAETDFKDLVIDFNQELGTKDTIADAKEYFDSALPYIAELANLLEEPETAIKIFKSVNVIFDAEFTNDNYSVVDSGNDSINTELYNMRGQIDYYLKKMEALKDEMDAYNEEHPLDAGSTESDPVWDAKIERMHSLIDAFFGDYGPVGAESFIESKLEEPADDGDDSSDVSGPEEGLVGDIYAVITKYPNGIPLDSDGQAGVLTAVNDFRNTVYELMSSGYSGSDLKEEFDVALPYLNKAFTLINDTEAVEDYLNIVYETFAKAFLEDNGSIPESYDEDFANEISQQRGKMKQAISSMEYYNSRIDEAMASGQPDSVISGYTAKIDEALDNFIAATGVESYQTALNRYLQEQSDTAE